MCRQRPEKPNLPERSDASASADAGDGENAQGEEKPEAPPLEEKPVEKSEMPDMNIKNCLVLAALTCALGANCGSAAAAQAQQKDYLSPLESDKIRDAETTNDRIKLFLTFADDRLKKFQYELQHPSSNKHPEMLNALMNGYVGCVDDAADLMQLGVEKQENVRAGIDLMATRTKEFLDVLNKLAEEQNRDRRVQRQSERRDRGHSRRDERCGKGQEECCATSGTPQRLVNLRRLTCGHAGNCRRFSFRRHAKGGRLKRLCRAS